MNTSRKHKLHNCTKDNFYCLHGKHTPDSWLHSWDWKTYILAEHDARNRRQHREFRKALKKGEVFCNVRFPF